MTVDRNDTDSILEGTEELVREVIARNELATEDIVSCIFTCTPDLDAVPLICAREIDVPDALPRVIRLLVHCYADDGRRPQHVYLRDAASLRRDLEGAQ